MNELHGKVRQGIVDSIVAINPTVKISIDETIVDKVVSEIIDVIKNKVDGERVCYMETKKEREESSFYNKAISDVLKSLDEFKKVWKADSVILPCPESILESIRYECPQCSSSSEWLKPDEKVPNNICDCDSLRFYIIGKFKLVDK